MKTRLDILEKAMTIGTVTIIGSKTVFDGEVEFLGLEINNADLFKIPTNWEMQFTSDWGNDYTVGSSFDENLTVITVRK